MNFEKSTFNFIFARTERLNLDNKYAQKISMNTQNIFEKLKRNLSSEQYSLMQDYLNSNNELDGINIQSALIDLQLVH